MNSVVCTLFEGYYHNGLAGLINSLSKHGFKGEIYAGYRGNLPFWATSSYKNDIVENLNCKTLKLENELFVHLIELETDYHFANYKANFLLAIWNGPAKNADNLFYFDPDIVNKCPWEFYEQWVRFGIALVHEITWNDMPPNHPKRAIWNQVAAAMGIEIKNNLTSNLNSGFVGIHKSRKRFLEMWCSMMEYSIQHFNVKIATFNQSNNSFSLFGPADQDLFNLAAMCSEVQISEMGPEAMDFIGGGWTMSHATGSPKPWKKDFLLAALHGNPPSRADKEYWNYANGIINPVSEKVIKRKQLSIKLASFIGRFYRKY